MSIFSASLSISGSFSTARVSYSSASCSRISRVSCGFSVRRSRRHCPCAIYASNVRAMGGLVEDKRASVLALGLGSQQEVGHSRVFLDVRSEEELLSGLRKEVESGRLPSNIADRMEEVYHNYRNAVLQSGNPKAREIILSNMAVAFDRMLLDVEDPFTFSPYHEAIREPFDYYVFGQKYIRPLIDFRRSYVGNIAYFHEMEKQLQQGDNVVLISNHQTEADPAIIALLLETTNPYLAEKMTCVAGDRVLTDPVCKPFSMGRNLLCVYSKKHMNDIPELIEMKRRANTRSLKEMALLLRGQALFDSSSVDNIRRLLDHSGVPGHIYSLGLLCYDVMPPPPQVEKQIGERRLISYHGVGLSVAPEMSFSEIASDFENHEEAKAAFPKALYASVTEQYSVLKSAIHGNQGLDASNSIVSLSQPWK
eukprot:TRINITY_DN6708_c0_g1_i3.p1 TRINITY_DN6708_c0_g1~~TRINITY_DN6708_c0_g1_i3.p1  ORF type:complete len:423 (+),score=87.38 TRINITY_DN6708_c0_g1_i3:409-1677(+)